MDKTYVDFMCASLISTIYDNNTELIKENEMKLVLVSKDNSKSEILVTNDTIESKISELLISNSIMPHLSSIDIMCNGKIINTIEIM